ncbi:hypothetical protein QYE76_030985 [Lolium multiflorum]|uniref:BHLH domain-containing protein n=1 Tax=Lolium multiflorum TaxID=4521 RepID=A0AAD8QRB9_LOLMU|nr:hypothetical protein QYE76_030985 [Lolium multiflorum]
MMNDDNGDGVGVERYASSDHGVLPMAWHSQTASSYAPPALRDMDSFAWASVSRSTAMTGASLFPPTGSAGYEHIPADSGGLERAGPPDGSDSKKRKRSDEAKTTSASVDSAETERSKDANGEETGPAAVAGGTSKVKGAKEAGEPQKEGYVHVRARSGQATNRHSVAEKLRREKISERMKLLQDLVPGCNKVTGKAVMLDEIINYVQSLQRQVEFLAMKLSAVNPTLGVNLESLVAKDVLRFPWSPSTPLMGLSFPSQPGLLQGNVHGMANSDMFRTLMQSLPQEPPTQVHHTLSGSFDDAVQMVYSSEDPSIRPEQNQFHM